MNKGIERRLYPNNPLGIIALFVFFIEAISTVSLKFMLDYQSPFVGQLVWFIILYPSAVGLLFFGTLWLKRESFYSPADFRDDASFVGLVTKLERLEVKQEAAALDPASDADDFFYTLKKLVSQPEIYTAIQLARAPLKEGRYETSRDLFEYLRSNVSPDHELYSRILANLAYSSIGLEDYDGAIEHLLLVKKLRPEQRFYVWHAVALAFAYLKKGDHSQCDKWLDYARSRREFTDNVKQLAALYPDLAANLVSLQTAAPRG